ncbi:hypothetical protein CARUB_v10015184mg [Capsella rubella]|uniref:Uncharacterized protein n=1 Tax=Capsella rubella TaxID=81985 RepID=R0HQA8_9BRAS|nr:hypothetical protein CARUB_v10015184mg [Capsella rubella]
MKFDNRFSSHRIPRTILHDLSHSFFFPNFSIHHSLVSNVRHVNEKLHDLKKNKKIQRLKDEYKEGNSQIQNLPNLQRKKADEDFEGRNIIAANLNQIEFLSFFLMLL